MADLVPIEANVTISESVGGQRVEIVQAGEAIARGEVYYKNATDSNKAYLAQCDDTAKREAAGVCLSQAGVDGFIVGLVAGQYVVGAPILIPNDYVLSQTPGKIAPRSDLTTGDTVVELFNVASTTEGVLKINNTRIVVP